MKVAPRFRVLAVSVIGTLAIALALIVVLRTNGAGAATTPADQTRYLLRLADLPPGYAVLAIGAIGSEGNVPNGPDMPCGKIEPANPVPRLAKFIDRFSPAGCFAAYYRAYRAPVLGPHPLLAGSGVLDAGSVAAAEAGFEVAPLLLDDFLLTPQRAVAAEQIGDATMLLHMATTNLIGDDELGTYLVWRSGPVLGVILTTGRSQAANDRAAYALARLQQPHLEHPTPYLPAERDSREVWLDNPALKRPIYWLGRSFVPGGGLPKVSLIFGTATPGRGGGSHQHTNLLYGHGLNVNVWTKAEWNRRVGRDAPSSVPNRRCARARTISLAKGHATIFATYPDKAGPCPSGPPRIYLAQAFVGDSVVRAEVIAICATCAGPGTGPYNSWRGLEAVVRGLEVRPKPVF